MPKALFARSADAIWRKSKYSRQVDAIGFRTIGEFRGGFANEQAYNFWTGDLSRDRMPFYVMYELTAASVGSRLTWQGQLFWETSDGRFEEIVHERVDTRPIREEDAGKRVYAVFFPGRDEWREFRMEPSASLWLAAWARVILTLAGGIAVLWLTLRPRWPAYFRALTLFGSGLILVSTVMAISGVTFLGRNYSPHGGGDDGLVHDGWGHGMALLAGEGNVIEALKGFEAVYWFTPGIRYLRMVEKLIFGDTNHLYALVLACIPIVVFYLLCHFTGARRAWLVTALFCLLPVGNLSFLQYVTNARIGYGEAAAMGLFLLGLMLLLRSELAWGGKERNLTLVGVAGAALAASLFIRPNFAIAVVWLGAAGAWASLRRRDFPAVLVLGLGLSLALWMPFHNWYYGGEFVLVSASGALAVPLGPGSYVAAAGDLLRGRFDTVAVIITANQVKGWLSGPAFVDLFSGLLMPVAWAAHVVRLVALALTCWVALRWAAGGFVRGTDLAVVAVASICAHLPMLFVHATFDRYAMLGWDLSLLVLIVWFVRLTSVSGGPHTPALGEGAPT